MNARGIPSAAQQVFAVLICPSGEGVPTVPRVVPTLAKGGTYLCQGVPTLTGGYLTWPGVPTRTWPG